MTEATLLRAGVTANTCASDRPLSRAVGITSAALVLTAHLVIIALLIVAPARAPDEPSRHEGAISLLPFMAEGVAQTGNERPEGGDVASFREKTFAPEREPSTDGQPPEATTASGPDAQSMMSGTDFFSNGEPASVKPSATDPRCGCGNRQSPAPADPDCLALPVEEMCQSLRLFP